MKTRHHITSIKNRITQRRRNLKIQGVVEGVKEGWKMVHIWGAPYERGYAHGALLHKELTEVFRIFPFVVEKEFKTSYEEYLNTSNQYIYPIVKDKFPEFYEELRGIAQGYKRGNTSSVVTIKRLIAWNAYMSLFSLYKEGGSERCSAFISTSNGNIVMAHNTHTDFVSGALFNIILRITPQKDSSSRGSSFRMQTAAGLISSITDWFICSNGLIGCETTISAINYRPTFGENGYPLFCRIRQAMQYAQTLDDMTETLLDRNAGDYACSWLFGDTRTGEIMRFEIGHKIHSIERTTNGIFYGMNSAVDWNLRELETNDMGANDMATSSGSRSYRLYSLLNPVGKTFNAPTPIDAKYAKRIMGDHYDEYVGKTKKGHRSICRHTELESTPIGSRHAHYPFGTIDAKVVTTKMAEKMEFWGLWGSGCGHRDFHAADFVQSHPEYKEYANFLPNLPNRKWAVV